MGKILPQNYFQVMSSLSEENFEDFMEWVCTSWEKERQEEVWDQLLNSEIKVIFEKHKGECGTCFSQMSSQRKQKFLNDKTCMLFVKDIFWAGELSTRLQVIEYLSEENFVEFLNSLTSTARDYFIDFLDSLYETKLYQIDTYQEDRKLVFSKLAGLPAELLAKFFEEAEADIVCEILQHMIEEDKIGLCRNFHGNVYKLLEETDFALLPYLDEFPEWNFDEVEMQDFFYALEEREIDIPKTLSAQTIQAIYCVVADRRIKEKILFNFTEMLDKKELYEGLQPTERMEMLEIMVGKKAAGKYDTETCLYILNSVKYILEEKEKSEEGLSYFEKLVLKDLKADCEE